MSDSRAFIYNVEPTGLGNDELNSYNGTSPSWMLTFIRWRYRDTLRIKNANVVNKNPNALEALKETLDPLVVTNDCLSVVTTSSKSSFTPSVEIVLLQTDTNYLTAIAPGDFVFVNMLNWSADVDRIYQNAISGKGPINGLKDGFKGLFKVQSVRRTVTIVDPKNGIKSVLFRITGFAFTEFNNMLYFDPSVTLQTQGSLVFASRIAETYGQVVNANQNQDIQDLISILIGSFIGSGINKDNNITGNEFQSPNDKFFMPAIIGRLLGIPTKVEAAKDIYNYLFGIQNYTVTGNNTSADSDAAIAQGMNPKIGKVRGRFFYTTTPCAGKALPLPEYWNQVKAWDVLSQYINGPLNEFFTTFRVDRNGKVMPTVILRQIPFTSEDFVRDNLVGAHTPVTKFMTLPRWKINPALLISQDIGRDDAARVNFVQLFARIIQGGVLGADYTLESKSLNYVFDLNDIQRSGLRPNITASMFDVYGSHDRTAFNSPIWARIVGDAKIGGHLKMNGTFIFAGIPDPIAVGDNLEFEGIVYHIEQVVHNCTYNPTNGEKTFRTIIKVSQGVSVTSSAKYGTIYAEMLNSNAYRERDDDYDTDKDGAQILPGISESQAIASRGFSVDKLKPLDKPNTSFPQPKQINVLPNKPNTIKKKRNE